MAIRPATLSPASSTETVLPSSFNASIVLTRSAGCVARSPAAFGEPRNKDSPSTVAVTPLPPIALARSVRPRFRGYPEFAAAVGVRVFDQ